MRKTFITIAAIMMTVIMSLSFLGGCNLITVDGEKDMKQVIATVKISEDMAEPEVILKSDIVMSYLNYGYMYEYSYGYTREQVVKMIVNSLINNRVYVQNAMASFDKNNDVVDASKDKWDIDRYLTTANPDEKTASEINEATYLTHKDINDLIKSNMESEEKVQDSMPETVRTTPTGAANEVKELTAAEKAAYVQKGFLGQDYDKDDAESRKAYNKVIDLLESNELLGDYVNDLKQTNYYKETLQSYKEQKLLEKFEKQITDAARAKLTFSELEEVYRDKYDTQKAMDATAYAEKLSAATAADPVLVGNANGTYGYVYNLLLGASDEISAKLNKWQEDNPKASDAELYTERAKLFKDITAKDMPYSWIWSGFDGTLDGTTYTFNGDYSLTNDDATSLPFQGDAKLLNPLAAGEVESEDYVKEYTVTNTKKFSLNEFIAMMETYVYGETKTGIADSDVNVYKKVDADTALPEYEQRINELLFAFSTDDGSLNTYKGYAITPAKANPNDETWVAEFNKAARELLGIDDGTPMGKNSYIMTATKFGYHILFYSEVINPTYDYTTLTAYLDKFCKKTASSWEEEFDAMIANFEDFEDKDHYLYTLIDSVSSSKVSGALTEEQNKILNTYVYGENSCVVKYESRYADLLKA